MAQEGAAGSIDPVPIGAELRCPIHKRRKKPAAELVDAIRSPLLDASYNSVVLGHSGSYYISSQMPGRREKKQVLRDDIHWGRCLALLPYLYSIAVAVPGAIESKGLGLAVRGRKGVR